MTDFSTITACGECCTDCPKKLDGRCPGCIEADGRVPEWRESGRCRVHACTREHHVQFCGLCTEFPCERIRELIFWNPEIISRMTSLRDEYPAGHPDTENLRFSGRSNIRGREWTFDTVADAYEKIRPGYPEELYRTLLAYCPLSPASRTVEVGIGGGQATLPVLKTGCDVTAVEYGEQLARVCREKFKGYPGFSVITGRFEETDLPDDSYDLVYSASAFHWIPEETGYTKVFRMLKPGGVFARFANHPYRGKDHPDLFEAIDGLYGKYYYPYYGKLPEKIREYTEDQAAGRAKTAEKYGFTDIQYALFYRTRTLSADEYRALLGTCSDHIAMEESVRERFLDEIGETINRFGGIITLFDTIDLQLARKPL